MPSHILPSNVSDPDIPPIERWSPIPLTLSPDGFVTPSTLEDSGSDTDLQDWVIRGNAASTLSLDPLPLELWAAM